MVALVWDATAALPERRFPLTFGRSRSEFRWTDRRELNFEQLAELLAQAPVGGKDGSCYTPAIFTGYSRRMDQAAAISIAVLDADCGHSFEEIQAAVAARGWRAIIHSTHSHMTTQTPVAAGAAEKWMADNPGLTIAHYMRAKKGYLPRVVESATILDEVQDGSARNLIVGHAPCPKFRIILPLEEPWVAAEFESQNLANAYWRTRIDALAFALDLHHDQSCSDTSRLFYLPRRRDEAQEYVVKILEGDDCPLSSLPDASHTPALLFDEAPEPAIRLVKGGHKTVVCADGTFLDLTEWAAEYAGRFEVVKALRARAPQILSSRRNGVKHHLVCPNAADHVTGGAEGTGTYAVNASDLRHAQMPSISSGFVLHCMHAGCASHDRLDHLAALVRAGTLTRGDITNPDFLTPAPPSIDASALLKREPVEVLEGDGRDAERTSNIPPNLYANLPGALRDMHAYMVATAAKPQPALALGAALAFLGAAIGRKAMIQRWRTRPNIYVLAVAHSGAGKDRLLAAPKQVAKAAGLYEKLIGVEEVASDAGIVSAVMKQPNQVMLLDEVSFLIGATNNARAGVHLANVTSTLLKLYSSSNTMFKGKSYADLEKVQSVDQPCVCMVGCSTPAGLFNALSSKDITNGLLSRCVLFDAGDHDPLAAAPANMPVPATVVEWLQAWDAMPLNSNPVAIDGGMPAIDPIEVLLSDEAERVLDAFGREMHEKKIKARNGGTDSLYVRAQENALKFALVWACSSYATRKQDKPVIDRTTLRVTGDTMRWACDLMRATIPAMETAAKDEIADSNFEEQLKRVRQAVEKAGPRGMTMSELRRAPAGRLPQKTMEDVIHHLCAARDVFYMEWKGRRGRPRLAYIHKRFVEENIRQNGAESE